MISELLMEQDNKYTNTLKKLTKADPNRDIEK